MIMYMVRHGCTDWNDKGLMQGCTDISINNTGVKQANEAKEKLKDINFDICISSPLNRTLQTSKIIIEDKCEIICDDLLLERGMGNFEGKYHEQYAKLNYWDYDLNNDSNGVESVKNILSRTKKFLDKIKKQYPNKIILIVSHAATIRAIHYNIIGYDNKTNFLDFKPQTGEVYKYEI